MPVPTSLNDLSVTASSNSPAGGDSIGTSLDDYLRAIQAIVKESGGTLYTASAADTITFNTTPTFASYATGQRFTIKAYGANTGAVTLNINGIGAKNVYKNGSTALSAGDIPAAGAVFVVVYDGTQFQLVNVYASSSYLPLSGGTLTGPINQNQGTNIASSSTINLTTATGNYVHVTGTTAITAITLSQGAERTVVFDGALTLTNGASLILPGGANITTAAGDCAVFRGEASSVVRCVSYIKASGAAVVTTGGITLGTPVASTSGTSIDFTSIPSGTKRIMVSFNAVSTNGTSNYLIQIGDSGGVETSSYASDCTVSATGAATANSTAGFIVTASLTSTDQMSGIATLTLLNSSTNLWVCSGTLNRNGSGGVLMFGGTHTLSGGVPLDRVRITTVGGADTFDNGSINIMYE